MPTMQKLMKNYGLFCLWLLTVCRMYLDYLRDPYDPNRIGTAVYGHNGEGDLQSVLILTAVELAVLYLILQPWSYHRLWLRSLMALGVLVPWTLISMIFSMHAGGVIQLHWMWLLVTGVILTIWTVISIVAEVKGSSS